MTEEGRRLYERDGGLEIGPMLEQARRQHGLTLDEVEQATKIRKRYLQGLENDDYGILPDAVYVQGFVKTYANYLGLDGDELAGELKSHRQPRRERHANNSKAGSGGFDKPLISPRGLAGAEKRRVSGRAVLGLLASILLIVLVIGILYYIGRDSLMPDTKDTNSEPAPRSEQASQNPESAKDKKSTAAASSEDPRDSKEEAGPEAEKGAAAPASVKSVEVGVRVEGTPAWISVLSDGTVVYEQVAEPGFTETFEADRAVNISTGNAGAVSLTVNGKDEGTMGEAGAVVSRQFTPTTTS